MSPSETGVQRPCAELKVRSSLACLARVRKFVEDFCRREGGAAHGDGTLELQLAVNEAAVAIMKHAYDGRPDRRMRIEAEADGGEITFTLRHWGRPCGLAPPGRGGGARDGSARMEIIQRCVDEMACTRDPGGETRIRLTKRRRIRGGSVQ